MLRDFLFRNFWYINLHMTIWYYISENQFYVLFFCCICDALLRFPNSAHLGLIFFRPRYGGPSSFLDLLTKVAPSRVSCATPCVFLSLVPQQQYTSWLARASRELSLVASRPMTKRTLEAINPSRMSRISVVKWATKRERDSSSFCLSWRRVATNGLSCMLARMWNSNYLIS